MSVFTTKYFKCTNVYCIDNKYIVWYPYEIPEDPTCNNCKELYEELQKLN